MSKIKIEDIQQTLAAEEWKLISEKYENLESEMIFECPEGHRVFSNWKKMKTKRKCPICENNQFLIKDTKIIPKPKDTKRTLALDQATKVTGWSIYDGTKLVKYGVFKTNQDDEEIIRCHQIKLWLISMISTWRPDIVGIEDIQFQESAGGYKMGVTVFQTLAHLQGILMEAIFEQKIPFKLCPTNTWRHHCGVKGKTRADKKKSMQLLAKKWYDITITDDEADAIGIGKYVAETNNQMIIVENWE